MKREITKLTHSNYVIVEAEFVLSWEFLILDEFTIYILFVFKVFGVRHKRVLLIGSHMTFLLLLKSKFLIQT